MPCCFKVVLGTECQQMWALLAGSLPSSTLGRLTSKLGLADLRFARSPPPGIDEIASVAKAITETEGVAGVACASLVLGQAMILHCQALIWSCLTRHPQATGLKLICRYLFDRDYLGGPRTGWHTAVLFPGLGIRQARVRPR